MAEHSTQENADTFFGDGEVNYRTFPTPEFLWSVIKRNALMVGVISLALSPLVFIKILTTGKTFESSQMLRFDSSDSFQVDNRPSEVAFLEVVQYLSRELDDQKFLEELAQRFPATLAEFPGYMLTGKYPELQFVRWFVSAPQKESDPVKRGKYLRSRIFLAADGSVRGSTVIRVTANGPTLEDAQKLLSETVNLLSEKFYTREVERVAVGVRAISDFLNNEKVKILVENARKESLDLPESLRMQKNSAQALKEVRTRQQMTRSRIREINDEIRTTIARRAQLEASYAELSRRYGPFHPERKAVESEIAEMRGKDGMARLSQELRNLEAQLVDAEADADSIAAAEETEERADKMILRVYGRLDRLKLEQQKLEEQVTKKDQRTRLAQIGEPSTPLSAESKRAKIAMIGGIGSLGLGVILAIIREILRKKASDKWRIDWILNAPCLLRMREKKVANIDAYDKKLIQSLRQKIPTVKKIDDSLEVYLDYRALGLWVKNATKGQVVLFVRSGQNPIGVDFIYRFAGVYSKDYAGKYLVLDMNASDGGVSYGQEERPNILLELILQKTTFQEALSKQNSERGYDLLVANHNLEMRLSEVISSVKFAEFMMAARRIYHKIFLIGLGSDNFVENSILLARSSDCVAIVDTRTTTLKRLKNIRKNIEKDNLSGYALLES